MTEALAIARLIRELIPDRSHMERRYEFKYLIRPELVEMVRLFLESCLTRDRFCDNRDSNDYSVRSIYFDSPTFECFHAKMSGEKHREKFRLRTYNSPGCAPYFLECKRRIGLLCAKDRIEMAPPVVRALQELDYDGLQRMELSHRKVWDRFFFVLYRRAYIPVLLVAYEREAFRDPEEEIRVCLDKNLRARMFPELGSIYEEDRMEYSLRDYAILEIKFSQLIPQWMEQLQTRFRLKRQACSKYCTSIAYFMGECPSLRGGLAHV